MTGKLCWAMCKICEYEASITLICSQPAGHPDGHYDDTFSRGWKRDEP